MVPLLDLPDDVFHLLLSHLNIQDILQIRQTCKSINLISQSRVVWQSLLTSLAVQQVPLPSFLHTTLDQLTGQELEHFVRKAWVLHRNWTSGSPTVAKKRSFKLDLLPSRLGGPPPILEFIQGRGRRYLLTLAMSRRTDDGPIYDLQCWDLNPTDASTSPMCIAHRTLNRGWVVFNQRPGSLVEVAVQSPGIELLGIDFSAENPASGFYTISYLPSITDRLVTFHESFLITRNEQNQLSLSHIRGQEPNGIRLHSSHPHEQVFDVLIQGRTVIVVRLKRLEIFAIDELNANQMEIYPVAQHVFQWNIDSLAVSPQKTWPPESDNPYPIVNILIRFGSLLPWPVNLIHHFVLLPNSMHDTGRPITWDNVPYSAVPVERRRIGAPVRLFSNYHMAIGSHGTAVWIDNHTEQYSADGGRGQRLAGSCVGKVLSEENEYSSVFGYSENDEWTRVAVDEKEGRIAISCLDGTVVVNEYA